jgi:hypothetical protein
VRGTAMVVSGLGSWALLIQQDPLPVIAVHSACTSAFRNYYCILIVCAIKIVCQADKV